MPTVAVAPQAVKTSQQSRRRTRADWRALPEGPPYFELIDGEFVELARPQRNHDRLSNKIYVLLDSVIEAHGLGELSREPNLYLDGTEDVYHPDFAFIAVGSSAVYQEDGIHGTPDMVCEILSPDTVHVDRGRKRTVYGQAGVRHLWLISPQSPIKIEEHVLTDAGQYVVRATVSAPDIWEPEAFPGWTVSLLDLERAVSRPRPTP